jgi:hypothetical protein
LPTQCPHGPERFLQKIRQLSDFVGERGGTRTRDPMIKSHVLYRLSYALTLEHPAKRQCPMPDHAPARAV